MVKKYEVRLKAGHPGEYHRGGHVFTGHYKTQFEAIPVILSEEQLTDDILNDEWLEVIELPEEESAA